MLVIPAVDLREGKVVQLVGGDYRNEAVRLDDPRAVAQEWARAGFRRLHCVDLDAATGRGSNASTVNDLLADGAASYQVGGGVRSDERIDELLSAGAEWVVVGTRAIEEPEWLAAIAARFPARLIVAADVRERRVVTRGWAAETSYEIIDAIADMRALPLAGLLVTAVHREGQMQGTDLPLMQDVAEASPWPVFASGGVTTPNDLRELDARGLAGVIIGMALYTGALDARLVAEEYAA